MHATCDNNFAKEQYLVYAGFREVASVGEVRRSEGDGNYLLPENFDKPAGLEGLEWVKLVLAVNFTMPISYFSFSNL